MLFRSCVHQKKIENDANQDVAFVKMGHCVEKSDRAQANQNACAFEIKSK
jgi:hypothetical protein